MGLPARRSTLKTTRSSAHDANDVGEVGEGAQGLQPHDDLAGATGQDLEGALGRMRPGIDHDGAGKAGLELGQLPDERALHGSALDGVEIGDIAGRRPQPAAERLQQRHRIADFLGHQRRGHRFVAGAVAALRPDGEAA